MPSFLSFDRLRASARMAVVAASVFALACGSGDEPEPSDAPAESSAAAEPKPYDGPLNLVLITLDTTRADALGTYGQTLPTSPSIDAMAREGTLFEQAITSSPSTAPSHATFFTGKQPYAHGLRSNSGYVLPQGNVTLAEVLREHGYATAAEIAAPVLGRQTKLDQGFDRYRDILETLSPLEALDLGKERPAVERRPGDEITRNGIVFMRSNAERPFFLWLHYFDAHLPHDPPVPFRRAIRDDDLYFAEVRRLDHQVGKVLYEIVKLGLRERTLVVLTADHGEGRGDHGELTHSYFVYDSTMRIPLIFFGPDVVPRGTRVDALARGVDITPTVLDLLGLPPLEGVQGQSLRPLLEQPTSDLELAGYGESIEAMRAFGTDPLRFLRVGDWKYVHKPEPELYDIASDPGETSNLAAQHPERVEALRARLIELVAEAPSAPPEAVAALSDAQRRELEALGYVAVPASPELDDELATLELSGPDANEKLDDFQAIAGAWATLSHGDDPKAAEARFRELWGRYPDSKRILYGLISALIAQGRSQDAIPLLQRGIELEPNSIDYRTILATQLVQRGDRADAIQLLRQALLLDPCHTARQQLADQLFQAARYREQVETLDARDASCARSAELDNALAYALATSPESALRDGQRALELAQALVAGDAQRPDFLDTQACALAEIGKYERAADVQRRALELVTRYQLPDWLLEVLKGHLAEFEARRPVRDP